MINSTTNKELEHLRGDWPLTEIIFASLPKYNAHIGIIGAYEGKLMELFAVNTTPKTIVGYEPQLWAHDKARVRLEPYNNCVVYPYGLGIQDESNVPMGFFGTDGCSILAATTSEDVGIGNLHDALPELINATYDLVVVNIEGYEFILLPYLLEKLKLSTHIHRLAVQFHDGYSLNNSEYAKLIYDLNNEYEHNFGLYLPSWGYWWSTHE